MLEIEFVDRSVALAAKAFVSFLPTVIIVAAFVPEDIRRSIISTLTHRLGMRGDALQLTRDAFASADDIRTATGILGLVLTIFFATSFTTALQRVYLRAWRRPHSRRSRRVRARRELAAAGPGLHGGARGVARRASGTGRASFSSPSCHWR